LVGELFISPEIRSALPAPILGRLAGDESEFLCVACHLPGSRAAGDDVSVVLVEHSDGPSITCAHASCTESVIIESPTPRPDHSDAIDDVVSVAGVLPSLDGPRPF
jgi:hypothetical protein